MTLTTNPGSADAKRLGCTCPVLDNAYGKGAVIDGRISEEMFYTDPDCPIHVDRRRLDAESRGEGDSGGAGQADDRAGDDSASDPVPTQSIESLREGEGASTLPGADGGRSTGPQVRGTEEAGQQGDGQTGQAQA